MRHAETADLTGRPGADPAKYRAGPDASGDHGGVLPSLAYIPRAPVESVLYQIVLYQIVLDHFERFRADAAGAHDGDRLPRLIEEAGAKQLSSRCLPG